MPATSHSLRVRAPYDRRVEGIDRLQSKTERGLRVATISLNFRKTFYKLLQAVLRVAKLQTSVHAPNRSASVRTAGAAVYRVLKALSGNPNRSGFSAGLSLVRESDTP